MHVDNNKRNDTNIIRALWPRHTVSKLKQPKYQRKLVDFGFGTKGTKSLEMILCSSNKSSNEVDTYKYIAGSSKHDKRRKQFTLQKLSKNK